MRSPQQGSVRKDASGYYAEAKWSSTSVAHGTGVVSSADILARSPLPCHLLLAEEQVDRVIGQGGTLH